MTNPEADPSDWNIVDLFAYVAQQQGYVSRKEAVKALGEAAFLNLVERCALDHAESVFRTTAIDNSAGQEIGPGPGTVPGGTGPDFHRGT